MGTRPSIQKLVDRLREGVPKRDTYSLQQNGPRNSLYVVVMHDAWSSAGVDYEDPGEVTEWWFEEQGVLLIDFGNQDKPPAAVSQPNSPVATDGGEQDGEE